MQRRTRRTAIRPPRKAPYLRTASRPYWEQVGWKRHCTKRPTTGLNTIRYRWINPRNRYASGDRRRLVPSEIACEVAKEILFGYGIPQAGSIDPNHDIVSGCDPLTMQSYNFPQNPFYAIPPDSAAAFFGDGQAKPAGIFRDRRRNSPVKNKPLAAVNVAPGENGLNITFVFQAAVSRKFIIHVLFLAADTRAQPFSSLGPAAGQDGASVLGRHPFPETVIVDLFPVGWLKCSFHRSLSNCSRLKQSLLL